MSEADAAAARLQALVDAHHLWAADLDMKELLKDRSRLVARVQELAGALAAAEAELVTRTLPADAAIAEAIRKLRAEYVDDSTAWTALSHALSFAQGAVVATRDEADPAPDEEEGDDA